MIKNRILPFVILIALSSSMLQFVHAADYFWVGDSGDWSDISHWATTSGGNVFHTQTPTSEDDVYFDANSFLSPGQTVTISGNLAFARNLDFSSVTMSPIFQAEQNATLNIFGSIGLVELMQFEFDGTVIFSSSETGLNVDFSNHTAGSNVIFDGSGEWNVLSDLSVTDEISVLNGNVIFTDGVVNCQFFNSRSTSSRIIDLGNTILNISGITSDPRAAGSPANIYTMWLSTDNLAIIGNKSTIRMLSDYQKIYMDGNGQVTFSNIELVLPTGLFSIINRDNNTFFEITGKADLRHTTEILTSALIDSLILYPSFSYQLLPEDYTINFLDAVGTCTSTILLNSTTGGNASRITAGQTLQADYLTLRDIHIVAGNAIADNSIDLGNNNGWTITAKTSEDYYWIGGSGNWNDGQHWSTSSGGAPSNCVPSAVDNVIFDNNSFNQPNQQVTINVLNATCKDMIWTGTTNSPTLSGPPGNNLFINGSLLFEMDMTHSFEGDYHFVSNATGNVINTAGQALNQNMIFDNPSGGWTLNSDLYVEGEVQLVSGALNTDGYDLDIYRFYSEYKLPRTLILGTSTLNLTKRGGDLLYWIVDGDNLTFDAGSSHIIIDGFISELITYGDQELFYYNVTFLDALSSIRTFSGVNASFNKLTFEKDAFILGNNTIDSLVLKNGFTYNIESAVQQDILQIISDDPCNGIIYFSSTRPDEETAIVRLAQQTPLEGFYLEGIEFDSPNPVLATNSIDGGNNVNVNFQTVISRDLYWVGGQGDWDDPSHWSEQSGGPGGACIPTIVDNVFFDDQSFNTLNDQVFNTNNNAGYCRNFNFNITDATGYLSLPFLNFSGNINMVEPWRLLTNLEGIGGNGNQSVFSNGSDITGFIVSGSDEVNLLDDLNVTFTIRLRENSNFNSNGYDIDCDQLYIDGDLNRQAAVNFSGSTIRIHGVKNRFTSPLNVRGKSGPGTQLENAVFELTNVESGGFIDSDAKLGCVLFSNTNGSGTLDIFNLMPSFSKLQFFGNGSLNSQMDYQADSLFFTSGKTYTVQGGQTFSINHFIQAKGNNCLPISWSSNISGVSADLVFGIDIETSLGFIEMRDLRAIHDALIDAGPGSTNIGASNEGWLFSEDTNNNAQTGFFGDDIVLCSDSILTLMPFNDNEILSILWSTGESQTSIQIDDSATIDALVVFSNNCSVRDTINIAFEEDFNINIGQDTILCENESLILNVNLPNATSVWQDGSVANEFAVSNSGIYSVRSTIGTCSAEDSILVTFQQSLDLSIPSSIEACEGQLISVDASIGLPANYSWSNGNQDSIIEVEQPGEYAVLVEREACSARDTFTAIFHENPSFQSLSDQTICDGEQVELSIDDNQNWSYLWNNGNSSSQISIQEAGTYTVTVTSDRSCVTIDSMNLAVEPIPFFTLPNDTVLCQGENLNVSIEENYPIYNWSNGENGPSITLNEAGTYSLETILGNCSFTDELTIQIQELPVVELGRDTTICDGQNILLSVEENPDWGYAWSTGENANSINVSSDGTYTVTITGENACVVSDTIMLGVDPLPIFNLPNDTTICEGANITIGIDEIYPNYSWSTGQSTPMIIVDVEDSYTLQTQLGNCTYSDNINISVQQLPIIDLGGDTTICEMQSIVLDATTADAVYTWNNGVTVPSIEVGQEGFYSVDVEVNGCQSSASINLEVAPSPVFELGEDLDLCEGEMTTLTIVTDNDWIVEWNTGSTDASITVSESSVFQATSQLGQCIFQDDIAVTFHEIPQFELGEDFTKCEDNSVLLSVDLENVDVIWQDGSIGSDYDVDIGGIYSAEVTSEFGCTSTDMIEIDDRTCSSFSIYMPNAFSPNQDGQNDFYLVGFSEGIVISDFEMEIYNRWGNQVFQTNVADEGWDGKIGLLSAEDATYIARVQITYSDDFESNITRTFTESVTLLR